MANLKYHNPNTGLWEEIKVSTKFKDLYNTTKLTQDQNYANIGITNYNPEEDVVFAIWNSTWLQKDEDYIVNGGLLRIESKDGSNWSSGDTFNFVVLKNVDKDALPSDDGSLIQDGSITIAKLATSIQGYITKIGVAALTTTAVTLSDAINDLNTQLSERVYKSKNSLPVADSSLSATDFASNIATLYTALGAYTDLKIFVAGSNFSASIAKKLTDDLGTAFTSVVGFVIEMSVNTSNTIPNKIFIYPNGSTRIFYISYDNAVSTTRELTTEDSGWLDIPLASGISNYDNAKYKKIRNTLYLNGRVAGITGTSGIVGTLPSGYRPIYNFNTVVILAVGETANLTITTAGVMTIYSTTTLTSTDFVGLNCSFAI